MSKECESRLQTIAFGFRECSEAFTAIGDPTRQLILLILLKSDFTGIRVGEIAAKTHLTRSSVSHHLRILKEAGIVAMRKEGTKNYYYLNLEETRWKSMAQLILLIHDSIQSIH